MRLEELADMLRLAFSTAEPPAPGKRAAALGYRVHIHKERMLSKGKTLAIAFACHALTSEPCWPCSVWGIVTMRQVLSSSPGKAELSTFG